MQKYPSTKQLLHALVDVKTQSEFLDEINIEFELVSNYSTQNGYIVDEKMGFLGKQVLQNVDDLFNYQYYRDLHFLFWGFKTDHWIYDSIDTVYYGNLHNIAAALFDSKS